jgi:FMN phosphatase YigB (HAD superfamily)
MSEVQPKLIFVDWYKTLSTSLFWINHSDALLSPQELNGICSFLFNESGLVELWMTGFITSEKVAAEIAAVLHIDARRVLQELEYSCKAMELSDTRVPSIIYELREQGIKVVLATDNMDTFERWTVPALELNLMFDGIISSPSRGALKSEIQGDYSPFFSHYLEQNGIKPTEAVLVDDSPIEEVVRSTGLGFRRVNHPNHLASILSGLLKTAEV